MLSTLLKVGMPVCRRLRSATLRLDCLGDVIDSLSCDLALNDDRAFEEACEMACISPCRDVVLRFATPEAPPALSSERRAGDASPLVLRLRPNWRDGRSFSESFSDSFSIWSAARRLSLRRSLRAAGLSMTKLCTSFFIAWNCSKADVLLCSLGGCITSAVTVCSTTAGGARPATMSFGGGGGFGFPV